MLPRDMEATGLHLSEKVYGLGQPGVYESDEKRGGQSLG